MWEVAAAQSSGRHGCGLVVFGACWSGWTSDGTGHDGTGQDGAGPCTGQGTDYGAVWIGKVGPTLRNGTVG